MKRSLKTFVPDSFSSGPHFFKSALMMIVLFIVLSRNKLRISILIYLC